MLQAWTAYEPRPLVLGAGSFGIQVYIFLSSDNGVVEERFAAQKKVRAGNGSNNK